MNLDLLQNQLTSRVEEIFDDRYSKLGVQVCFLREDEIHTELSGNKFRKLKYNVLKAKEDSHDTLLTFGGNWSNHIYATAAAGKIFEFKTIGIIRGEEPVKSTDTLEFARSCGMKLHFISREEYREKEEDFFKAWLRDEFGRFHLVPEGGSNYLGLNGCMEILGKHSIDFDYICCSAGTGATTAGLLQSCENQQVMAFSALENGEFLKNDIQSFLHSLSFDTESDDSLLEKLNLRTEYAFGAYAKVTDELIDFIKKFYVRHDIKLDPIYTGKMMFGVDDLIMKGHFKEGSRILVIHTGGLQGAAGIEKRNGMKLFN